jgi:hypothetical protein
MTKREASAIALPRDLMHFISWLSFFDLLPGFVSAGETVGGCTTMTTETREFAGENNDSEKENSKFRNPPRMRVALRW